MKKKYLIPIIELSTYSMTDILANDNLVSDPWGFEDELSLEEGEESE